MVLVLGGGGETGLSEYNGCARKPAADHPGKIVS